MTTKYACDELCPNYVETKGYNKNFKLTYYSTNIFTVFTKGKNTTVDCGLEECKERRKNGSKD